MAIIDQFTCSFEPLIEIMNAVLTFSWPEIYQ